MCQKNPGEEKVLVLAEVKKNKRFHFREDTE